MAVVLTGNGNLCGEMNGDAELVLSFLIVAEVFPYALGLAGFNKYNIGIYSTEVLPLYLKKPQAQRLLEEKEKKLNK